MDLRKGIRAAVADKPMEVKVERVTALPPAKVGMACPRTPVVLSGLCRLENLNITCSDSLFALGFLLYSEGSLVC